LTLSFLNASKSKCSVPVDFNKINKKFAGFRHGSVYFFTVYQWFATCRRITPHVHEIKQSTAEKIFTDLYLMRLACLLYKKCGVMFETAERISLSTLIFEQYLVLLLQ